MSRAGAGGTGKEDPGLQVTSPPPTPAHPRALPASPRRAVGAGGAAARGSAARRRAAAGRRPAPGPGSPSRPAATTGSSARPAPAGSAPTRHRAPSLRATTAVSPHPHTPHRRHPRLVPSPLAPVLTGAQRQPQQRGSPAPLSLVERGEAGADAQGAAVPGEHPPAQAVHGDVGHLRGCAGVRPVPARPLPGADKPPALSPPRRRPPPGRSGAGRRRERSRQAPSRLVPAGPGPRSRAAPVRRGALAAAGPWGHRELRGRWGGGGFCGWQRGGSRAGTYPRPEGSLCRVPPV